MSITKRGLIVKAKTVLPLPLGEGWGEGLGAKSTKYFPNSLFEDAENRKRVIRLFLSARPSPQPSPRGRGRDQSKSGSVFSTKTEPLRLVSMCVRYRTESGSDRIISNQQIPADPVATAPGSDTLRGE